MNFYTSFLKDMEVPEDPGNHKERKIESLVQDVECR
jgi:hypothetical protein